MEDDLKGPVGLHMPRILMAFAVLLVVGALAYVAVGKLRSPAPEVDQPAVSEVPEKWRSVVEVDDGFAPIVEPPVSRESIPEPAVPIAKTEEVAQLAVPVANTEEVAQSSAPVAHIAEADLGTLSEGLAQSDIPPVAEEFPAVEEAAVPSSPIVAEPETVQDLEADTATAPESIQPPATETPVVVEPAIEKPVNEGPMQVVALGGQVLRPTFTSGIEDSEPIDDLGTVIQADAEGDDTQLYFFTDIRGMQGQRIVHRWEYNGRVELTIPFSINGDRWRVYSRKHLMNDMPGEWRVVVLDPASFPISTSTFTYVVP